MNIMSKFCYIVVPGNPPHRAVGAVEFGESGYCETTYDHCRTEAECRELVDLINKGLGITPEVEMAMLTGSMFGWNVPGAEAARRHFALKEQEA